MTKQVLVQFSFANLSSDCLFSPHSRISATFYKMPKCVKSPLTYEQKRYLLDPKGWPIKFRLQCENTYLYLRPKLQRGGILKFRVTFYILSKGIQRPGSGQCCDSVLCSKSLCCFWRCSQSARCLQVSYGTVGCFY